jgi:hypothetical protein
VRLGAAIRLDDQELLAEIARNGQGSDERERRDIRTRTLGHIKDKAVLADIALTNTDRHVRGTVIISYLSDSDQEILAEVAKREQDPNYRRIAIDKLKNQVVLADIAKNDKEDWLRKRAAARLNALQEKQ